MYRDILISHSTDTGNIVILIITLDFLTIKQDTFLIFAQHFLVCVSICDYSDKYLYQILFFKLDSSPGYFGMLGMAFRICFEKSMDNFDKPKHSTFISLCLKIRVEEGKSNKGEKPFS